VWGVQNAFNYLVQTVLSPDIGGYDPTTTPTGQTLIGKSPYVSASIDLGVTDGRYYSTSWYDGGRECGYMWWECLHHIGFYLDKIMAMEALSDSNTNFVARSTPEDLREWRVSFYNSFGEQLSKLNDAVMGQDWTRVAPYLDANGALRFPDYTGDLDEVHTTPVDPFATFSIQLYWQVLGLARFHTNFDQSFVEESRVFVLGTGNAPSVSDSRLVTFVDPRSGLTYGALRMPHRGAGESAIDLANSLLARSSYCDGSAGTATTADDCREPSAGFTREAVDVRMSDHVELLQALSMVNVRMSYGDPYDP
jgi:hypothetical protein